MILREKTPFRLPLAVVFTLALLAGCGGGATSPTAADLDVGDLEFQSLALINESRAAGGLAPVDGDGTLAEVARRHSEAMRDGGFLGHADPATGVGLRQRLRGAGVRFEAAAQNVVRVRHAGNPAGVAHAELLASTDHRANLLDSRFTQAGVGVARDGNVYWVTQIFIRP